MSKVFIFTGREPFEHPVRRFVVNPGDLVEWSEEEAAQLNKDDWKEDGLDGRTERKSGGSTPANVSGTNRRRSVSNNS